MLLSSCLCIDKVNKAVKQCSQTSKPKIRYTKEYIVRISDLSMQEFTTETCLCQKSNRFAKQVVRKEKRERYETVDSVEFVLFALIMG